MNNVHASLKKEKYQVAISSESGNSIVADEPVSFGGNDVGFNPNELLIASLAACTSITIKMYADHKHWDIAEVKVDVALERDEVTKITRIKRNITFEGNLDEVQLNRLLGVAKACPIHKLLSSPIEIATELVL